MALIFPDPQVKVFVPSTLEFEKYDQAGDQARYVVFKRSDAALASPVDGGATYSVEQTEDDSYHGGGTEEYGLNGEVLPNDNTDVSSASSGTEHEEN